MHIPLSEAIDRYKREPGAHGNAYDWYRRSAQRGNGVSIHGHTIPAMKVGRQWMVEESDLDAALAAMSEARALLVRRTADYDQRILHPGTVRIEGGGYRVSDAFHFLWNDMDRARQRSDGCWICNRCWTVATEEHDGEECHRCRDWSPCGTACTLSRIRCRTCGASQAA
ncbi:hypothetical protein [Streptomyces sp. NPDC053427]|uniref:hypothetical protein n=1 Tax=Streptomyces sp. NPDC053427 TaxID=3365701 RepID=UPI0037D6E00A